MKVKTPDLASQVAEIIIYVSAARRAQQLSLCKLVLRDEVTPRLRKLIKEIAQ